jgi:hypothetical protein
MSDDERLVWALNILDPPDQMKAITSPRFLSPRDEKAREQQPKFIKWLRKSRRVSECLDLMYLFSVPAACLWVLYALSFAARAYEFGERAHRSSAGIWEWLLVLVAIFLVRVFTE